MPQITVLAQKRRSGTFESPVWQAPANLTGNFRVETNILLADLVDPTKSIHLRAEVAPTSTGPWQEYIGVDWVGGVRTDRLGNQAGNPACTILGAEIAGKFVRIVAQVPSAIVVGVNLETA